MVLSGGQGPDGDEGHEAQEGACGADTEAAARDACGARER